MSRRRRRRGGRGRGPSQPKAAEGQSQTQAAQVQSAGGQARRRRRRGRRRPAGTQASAESTMARARVLQTLPADGMVLEDVIATMRDEYGPPATPQEYRLIIRTPEEPAESAPSREEPDSARGTERPMASRLRRRRRRRRSGSTDSEDIATEPEDPQEIPPVT